MSWQVEFNIGIPVEGGSTTNLPKESAYYILFIDLIKAPTEIKHLLDTIIKPLKHGRDKIRPEYNYGSNRYVYLQVPAGTFFS